MDHLGIQFEDGRSPESFTIIDFQTAGLAEAIGEPGSGRPFAAETVMMVEPHRRDEHQFIPQLHLIFHIESIGILTG